MKNWYRKYYRRIMVPLLCFLLVYLIWTIIHVRVTGVQIFCWSVMLLASVGFTVNNHRSEALHQALISLFYAAFAVEMWSKDRSLPWALPWVVLVSISTLGAIDAYAKSKKSHRDAEIPSDASAELQSKSS
ncbi:MAG: hypothetical protein ABSE51_04875 [Terracidiphilus sp.]|jgi:hypothetical protein